MNEINDALKTLLANLRGFAANVEATSLAFGEAFTLTEERTSEATTRASFKRTIKSNGKAKN